MEKQIREVAMKSVSILATILFLASTIQVVQAEPLPASKQTRLGLYLSASEAAEFLGKKPFATMVDVRTPEEIDQTGMADGVDALIPLAIADKKKGMVFNPDFYNGFVKLVQSRGLSADDPIVIICRSGNRSAQAVNMLTQLGFTRLYTVTDGYEGDRATSGPNAGERVINGWKNAGLPWHTQKAAECASAREGGAC